jgi:nucleotide-binding universal stress UspA family protein
MIKKILVPIAFSKYSRGMLDYAADLAEPLGAELFVVNVINERDLAAVNKITSFGYKVDSDKYIDIVKKERRAEIVKITDHLTLPDEKVSFSFLIGDPTSELLRFVVESEIDMVVMGIKNNDLRHVFAGSVAERMFGKCPVPILSYRGDDIAARLTKRIYKHIIDD